MSKVLIIHHSLRIGGGEKHLFELVNFALKNGIEPHILIVDNYYPEDYDPIYKKMGVPVSKTRLGQLWRLRNPVNLVKAVYWRLRLGYFSSGYDAVHVVNLDTADKTKAFINHKRKFYWHVGNSIQFPDARYPFSPELFADKDATLIFVNEYQPQEIEQQYGETGIGKVTFKLFVN